MLIKTLMFIVLRILDSEYGYRIYRWDQRYRITGFFCKLLFFAKFLSKVLIAINQSQKYITLQIASKQSHFQAPL